MPLSSWGSGGLPPEIFLKSSFFALKLRNSEQIFCTFWPSERSQFLIVCILKVRVIYRTFRMQQ